MDAHTLEGQLGLEVQIDLCLHCQVFWFDRYESVQLSPAATLGLFRIISEQQSSPPALGDRFRCPRCDLRLLLTHDRQRNTPFTYWRCGREHGRLITFFNFLREKDFIRPLSAQHLAELRQSVQTINCSNCGAPIDLTRDSSCGHCGSPVSMLDLKQIAGMIDQLQGAAQPRAQVNVDAIFDALRAERQRDAPSELVRVGLRVLGPWFSPH